MNVFRGGLAAVAACVLLLGVPRAAHAQIVNVQSLVGQETPEGVSGALDVGLDWRTGNVELFTVSGAAVGRYRAGDHLVFGIVRGAYGEYGEDETQIIGNTFEHVRYRWKLGERLTAEAFVQHEYDKFRRLELRALVGAGPRLTISNNPHAGLVLGVAYMFEREELDARMGADDAGATSNTHRASSYLLFTTAANDKVTFVETVYVQPNLGDFGDYRVFSESQLQVTLTTRFTFKTAFVLVHDSAPPDLVKRTDTSLQTSVSLRF